MNEKYVEALEQYELEIFSVRKGRGSWICETEDGCKLLKEYRGTVKRLEFEDQVLDQLDTGGALLCPQPGGQPSVHRRGRDALCVKGLVFGPGMRLEG